MLTSDVISSVRMVIVVWTWVMLNISVWAEVLVGVRIVRGGELPERLKSWKDDRHDRKN